MSNPIDITKQTLVFPLQWHGSLILENVPAETAKNAIEQTLRGCGQLEFTLREGNVSAQGRFCTWKITTVFRDLAGFRLTAQALGNLPGAKMLI